jgi:hypothetical protein
MPGDPGGQKTGLVRGDQQWPWVGCERTAEMDAKLGTRTLYIEPGSPWENGTGESFNGKGVTSA